MSLKPYLRELRARAGEVLLFLAACVLLAACLPFVLVMPAFLVLFLPTPHRQNRRCPECGWTARYVTEEVREGEGRRSWTDLIIAEYACANGHRFTKDWTGDPGFG